jgi:thioredoxin 1
MSNTPPRHFTDTDFETDVLAAKELVLVDFWASWCGPCRAIAPVVDRLADNYAGRVTIGKLNVDENGQVPSAFHVHSIPTLLLFRGGRVVDRIVGAAPQQKIEQMLDRHLAVS